MNVAIYTRVSTEDQHNENQLRILRDECAKRSWTIAAEYADVISGAKFDRPGLEAMMQQVKAKVYDAVLVLRIDRLGRSMGQVIKAIEDMRRVKCAFVAIDQGIDTSSMNPASELLMNVFAAFAQFERSMISERTKEGLARVKANGTKLGRPSVKLVQNWQEVIGEYRASPCSYRELAQKLGGVSVNTAYKMANKAA